MNSEMCALSVGDLIDERPLSGFQIRVFALCGLIILLDGFDSQCMGYLAPAIADDIGVPARAFGPVFAAGLFGVMIATISGPIADRWGRKWVIVISTLSFASFSIMTARATSIRDLLIWRFMTGVGLGGALSNAVALASEYMPKRLRVTFVTALLCGMPIGTFVGGLLSSVMIPTWGWRSVLYLGGALPLILATLSIKWLPESIRFLANQRAGASEVSSIARRIAPELCGTLVPLAATSNDQPRKLPIKRLFTEGRAAGTALLWISFFMNLLTIYFILSWLPGLMRQAGMPVSAGVAAVSIFSAGGFIATLAQGRLMAGGRASWVLSIEFAASAAMIALLALANDSLATTLALTFVLGGGVSGAQAGLFGLATDFYPTSIRATGVGWASGIGRIGSVLGPTLGGVLLSMQWTPKRIFLAAALPALGAATASIFASTLRKGLSKGDSERD
jgi:AAHS family 4-hydroxybenzoate transporter-like MFS transporter